MGIQIKVHLTAQQIFNKENYGHSFKGECFMLTQEKIRKLFEYDDGLRNSESLLEAACYRLAAEQAENWEGCDSTSPAYLYVRKFI